MLALPDGRNLFLGAASRLKLLETSAKGLVRESTGGLVANVELPTVVGFQLALDIRDPKAVLWR